MNVLAWIVGHRAERDVQLLCLCERMVFAGEPCGTCGRVWDYEVVAVLKSGPTSGTDTEVSSDRAQEDV